jgi:hypothetical protein
MSRKPMPLALAALLFVPALNGCQMHYGPMGVGAGFTPDDRLPALQVVKR